MMGNCGNIIMSLAVVYSLVKKNSGLGQTKAAFFKLTEGFLANVSWLTMPAHERHPGFLLPFSAFPSVAGSGGNLPTVSSQRQ